MTERLVRLFYASWDPPSRAQCQRVASGLHEAAWEMIDVATNEPAWRASGLRTVPAAQVLNDGATVAQFDGKLSVQTISAVAATPPPCSVRIEPLEVVASSGSYRYGRWAEPFVVSGSPDMGWSSASLPEHHTPWIVFDTLRTHEFTAIGITPRDWVGDPELKKCLPPDFDISVSSDGARWREALRIRGYEWIDSHPQYWDLDCTGRYIRFQAVRLERRPHGRYVCQLHECELWGQPIDQTEISHPATGRWDAWNGVDPGGSIEKFGIWHEQRGGTAVLVWRLPPGTSLRPRAFLAGRAKLLVLDGSAVARCSEDGEQYRLDRGQWLTQWPRQSISIINPSSVSPALVLEIRSEPETAEVWIGSEGE